MLFPDSKVKRIASKWLVRPLIILVIGSILILGVNSVVQAKYTQKKTFPRVTILHKVSPTATATPTKAPTVTPTPTLTPTPTPKPTSTPTPTPTSAPKQAQVQTQTPTTAPFQGGNIPEYLLGEVNKYRASQGVAAAQMDSNTCDFAKKRAQELASNFNHDGFKNLPYSGYSRITENIAMTSDYTQVIPMWINSPGHAENMRSDTPFICVENYGNYYDYEGWKP